METLLDLYSWLYLHFLHHFVKPPDGVFLACQYQRRIVTPKTEAAFHRYKNHPLVREIQYR